MMPDPTRPPPALPSGDPLPCQTTDPEVFYPEQGGENSVAQRRLAKALCAACPVRVECLDWALDNLPWGYAGGTTHFQRRKMLAARDAERQTGAA